MTIAICDDNPGILAALTRLLEEAYPAHAVCAYPSGEALLAAPAPDVLLLDIDLPGQSGMAVAEELRRRGAESAIVFITGDPTHVYEAFDVRAFHYLVKPFSAAKLLSVLERAMAEPRPAARVLTVQSGGITSAVRFSDIRYAEVFNRKVLLHTQNGEIEYYGKLGSLAAQAGEDFFRTHRAYLVNLAEVERYDAATVWLPGGQALLSKQNYPAFVRAYMQFVRRGGGKG